MCAYACMLSLISQTLEDLIRLYNTEDLCTCLHNVFTHVDLSLKYMLMASCFPCALQRKSSRDMCFDSAKIVKKSTCCVAVCLFRQVDLIRLLVFSKIHTFSLFLSASTKCDPSSSLFTLPWVTLLFIALTR